jgi:O-antigen/teichoic acid export membrane protein
MSDNFNKNRIIKNSLLLYVRMLFTMWINLYATRLVLQNLGVEDMGVYGVVGSIVSIFSVFTGGITSAVQRFITFEAGLKEGNVNKVFCSSLNVIFILAGILLVVLESAGLWFFYNKINIPEASREAAFWVFQFSILTCLINLISIPYNALIIAREKMNAFAGISIIQVILNCASAYLISFFDNRLLWYALFMLLASFTVRLTYQIYCRTKFPESKYHYGIDKTLLKEIGKYTGVSTTSSILQMISGQGITLVINWTSGVALNAVYNIALQLKNSILSFAMNLFKAIAPQITKTYANGELEHYKKLVYTGSKLEIFLIYFIMIPFLFRTEYIMKLWLGSSLPPYTVEFAQCIVFISLLYAAFEPIRTAILATNKIRNFMLIPESFYLLVLPISYLSYHISQNAIWLIVSIVGIDILTACLRVFLASRVSVLKIKEILKAIILPALSVITISCTGCYFLNLFCSNNLLGMCLLLITNSLLLIGIIYVVGLSKKERGFINKLIIKIVHIKYNTH